METNRVLPTTVQLTALVDFQLNLLIDAKNTFTAYTVAMNIRDINPSYEIEHLRTDFTLGEKTVQELVRESMDEYCDVDSNQYGWEYRKWNGGGLIANLAKTYYDISTASLSYDLQHPDHRVTPVTAIEWDKD